MAMIGRIVVYGGFAAAAVFDVLNGAMILQMAIAIY